MRTQLGLKRLRGQSGRDGKTEQARRNIRLILACVGLAVLTAFFVYQLQMRQDADLRWLVQQSAQAAAQDSIQTDGQEGARATREDASSDAAPSDVVSSDAAPPDIAPSNVSSPDVSSPDVAPSDAIQVASVRLAVPLSKQLPLLTTGCEATATAMMLQYAGASLTKLDVANEMPYSSDPSTGFVGNPFTGSGFTIYPQALTRLVRTQLGSAVDLSGTTLDDLRGFLQEGKPVCCWIADDQGYVHCVVVTGYEGDTFYLNDPLNGSTSMTAAALDHIWANNARRALSY
jgi:uncharacterized protein YvpB